MKFTQKLFILGSLILTSSGALAAGAEETRLRGFAEHQGNNKKFSEAREQGERAQLEGQEKWEALRLRNTQAYKATKKAQQIEISEDGPEAKADAAEKRAWDQTSEQERLKYSATRKKQSMVDREKNHLPSESQELGLDESRPRYDYKKRASFGAIQPGASPSSRSSGTSFSRGDSSPSFPPPPAFEDFNDADNGYVPPPSLPEDFGDVPPPPPPPPPPFDGDSFNSDFPPPPIPNFDNDDF